MPPGIEEDDDDSERDIPILEELLDNYSLSLPTNESYHFDIPLPYRPPAKPPDGDKRSLNAKAEAVQIILTGIDNDIYSTVDACPNACEMWKAIARLKQ
nr:hypothetical protein [Tanacetum cinerariifolium]